MWVRWTATSHFTHPLIHSQSALRSGSRTASKCNWLAGGAPLRRSSAPRTASPRPHGLARAAPSKPPAMALLQTSALSVPAALASAEVSAAAASSTHNLRTAFLAGRGVGRLSLSRQLGVQNGSRVSAWFKFGANGADSKEAGIYGSQKRDDFDKDDVEQYFNYMGMLATEGTYDKMNVLLGQGIPAVDILLLMASSEGDQPKVEELIDAGADGTVKNLEGKTAVDVAANDIIRDLIVKSLKANA